VRRGRDALSSCVQPKNLDTPYSNNNNKKKRKKAEPTVNTCPRLPLPAHLTNNPLKSEGMYIPRRRLSGYDHVVFMVNKGHISLVSHSRTVRRGVGEQGAEKYVWTEQGTSNNRDEKMCSVEVHDWFT
jgi:Txe/YoeB family toxin of Txe-Axe toxin-antitoxin module